MKEDSDRDISQIDEVQLDLEGEEEESPRKYESRNSFDLTRKNNFFTEGVDEGLIQENQLEEEKKEDYSPEPLGYEDEERKHLGTTRSLDEP